jgi:OPA family glycerol-3-phosphate transporter-like MFS transporter
MWKILRPPKHKPPVAAEKIDKEYKRLRLQVFIGIFIGYAGYYLVRKNFTLAMPHLVEMGFDKGDLGIALSANAIAYGLSKFLMGGVSDRSNARVFLPLGLVLSALVTMFLGTSAGISSIIMMFITQFLIGWFQGMGWPPCGRVMTHWFSQNERGTKMSVWNVAHNVGGGMIGPMAAYGLLWFGSWQIGTFWFPAVVAIVVAMLAFLLIRDTPQSTGLPQRLPQKLQREVGTGAYDEGNLLQIRTQQQDTLVYSLRQCIRVSGALRRTGLGADLPEGHQGL